MDLQLLKHAKGYIEKMANGINPLTNEMVPDNDLVNNVRISRCLFYINNVLDEVIENGGINKSDKLPFYLSRNDLEKYQYVDEDLTISRILKRINMLKPNENMSNLRAVDVVKWLIKIGVLTEVELNGKKTKVPTTLGKSMGVYLEHRVRLNYEYDAVVYKRIMQEFIIDNFYEMLEFINKLND